MSLKFNPTIHYQSIRKNFQQGRKSEFVIMVTPKKLNTSVRNCFVSMLFALALMDQANSQEVVFKKNPAIDSMIPKWGKNRLHYLHSVLGLGFAADAGETGATTKRPHFFDEIRFGGRYKLRLNRHFSIGSDLCLNLNNFLIKQNKSKTLPDTIQYKRQRMAFHQIQIGGYVRVNFGRRGNSLGHYIDLAGYANYNYQHFLVTKFQNGDSDNTTTHAKTSGFDYFNKFGQGVQLRLGFPKMLIYGQYRLSNYFKISRNLPELPRVTIGIEFTP